MHRNGSLVLVGSSRGFRIKRNIWPFFGFVDSFSNWPSFFAVLRVTGAIFSGGGGGGEGESAGWDFGWPRRFVFANMLMYAKVGLLAIHGYLCLLIKFKSHHSCLCPKRKTPSFITALSTICWNSHNNPLFVCILTTHLWRLSTSCLLTYSIPVSKLPPDMKWDFGTFLPRWWSWWWP